MDSPRSTIETILSHYQPITLAEMDAVRLMNRTDTKFVTSLSAALALLQCAADDYLVQEIDGRRIGEYYTVYFDTPTYDMYHRHEQGKANRQKLRIRAYVDSQLAFLEVKTKDNHRRTRKKRLALAAFDAVHPRHDIRFVGDADNEGDAPSAFVCAHLPYDASTLAAGIENRFERITLVNKGKSERLTIDLNVRFNNIITGSQRALDNVVIIELKRAASAASPILRHLRRLHIKPLGFSKYCLGTALTHPALPRNRIKQRLRNVQRIQNTH